MAAENSIIAGHDMNAVQRIKAFRDLHAQGCFVIPNPWDIGSARWLRGLGFKALATTSAGFALSRGRADQDVPLDMMLVHIAELVACVPDVPVNADFENAYADEPDGVSENVERCLATGVAGLSIEDATGRASEPLYDFDLAVARVAAARRAIDRAGSGALLTARAEGVLVNGAAALDDSCRRLTAFSAAGADVLYAPGLRTREQISAVIAAAGSKPVNMLMFGDLGHSVADLAQLGVRRISVGGALARAAWAGFMTAAEKILHEGSFAGFAANALTKRADALFLDDRKTWSPE